MNLAQKPPRQECICPNCGHREPYYPSTPCFNRRCPKCESPLTTL